MDYQVAWSAFRHSGGSIYIPFKDRLGKCRQLSQGDRRLGHSRSTSARWTCPGPIAPARTGGTSALGYTGSRPASPVNGRAGDELRAGGTRARIDDRVRRRQPVISGNVGRRQREPRVEGNDDAELGEGDDLVGDVLASARAGTISAARAARSSARGIPAWAGILPASSPASGLSMNHSIQAEVSTSRIRRDRRGRGSSRGRRPWRCL